VCYLYFLCSSSYFGSLVVCLFGYLVICLFGCGSIFFAVVAVIIVGQPLL